MVQEYYEQFYKTFTGNVQQDSKESVISFSRRDPEYIYSCLNPNLLSQRGWDCTSHDTVKDSPILRHR